MKFDMAGVRVMLAMPTHRDINPLTVRSLLDTQGLCVSRGISLDIEIQWGSSLVHHARTKAAWMFLQSDCTNLVWIDSDIVWSGADFLRLIALSTKLACVTVLYPCKTDPVRFCLNVEDERQVMATNEYGCISVAGGGMGLGFTAIQRSVMEALAEKAPKRKVPDYEEPIPYLFRCDDVQDGKARGEDMSFFADVRALGHDVHLDPNITLGHVGSKEYRASIMDYLVHTTDGAAQQPLPQT